MNYCPNCGEKVKEEQEVCLKCGKILKKKNTTINIIPDTKSRVAAGLLAIFLGTFGIHNFYLGNNGKAITQLLITTLTCGVGAILTGVWSLIEGILILTGSINEDATGKPLSD